MPTSSRPTTSITSIPSSSAVRGLVQVGLAGALWGTGGLAVQLLRELVPMSPLTISAYRMLIAATVLLAVLVVTGQVGALARVCRGRPVRVVVIGTGTAAYQGLYFVSVTQVGVAVATVVSLGVAPVLLTVVDCVRHRRRPDRDRVLVLATALAGLVLVSVVAGDSSLGPSPLLGVLLALASGTTYALTTVVGAPLTATTRPVVLTTAMTTVGGLVLLPALLVVDGPLVTTNPAALAWLLYLGVLTMALAYGLLYAGLRVTPPSVAVTASLVEPVTAAVAAWAVLGESLGVGGVVGTLLVLAAVSGLARTPADSRRHPRRLGPPSAPTRLRRRR